MVQVNHPMTLFMLLFKIKTEKNRNLKNLLALYGSKYC